MKVLHTLADRAGCGHYRCLYPAVNAKLHGVQSSYLEHWNGVKLRDVNGVPTVQAVRNPGVDIVVMQRPLRRLNVEMIEPLQRHGVAVVIDIDDDFSCVHPKHKGWRNVQPQNSPDANREWLAAGCRIADMVTVTTPALAKRYGGHGRVAVLPNFIPRPTLSVADLVEQRPGTVGWAGHVSSHPTDLMATRGGVGLACQDTGATFVNVGIGKGVAEGLQLPDDVTFDVVGQKEFADYPFALAEFSVGIAPLDDIAFNHAKSALKGLEMAAVGVPFVASPTPDYQRIADDGIGLLADWKAKDWRRKVKSLLTDESFRQETAQQARERVAAAYTYEDNAWRWVEAWEQAIANRRSDRRLVRLPGEGVAAHSSNASW